MQRLDPFGAGLNTGVNNIYSPFLGPLPAQQRTDPYERRNVDKWNMPENYRGKNAYLRDTVEDLIWTANETWYTTVMLPWEVTDQIHMQWTNLQANAHFMDTTPYQTPSSLVTQERQIRRASLVRRGIAAEFEHDFMRTPLGRISFLAALGQMARSVQETANAECVRALMNSHHFQHQYEREHGILKEHDLKGYLERDRFRFAIAQKTKNGLEKLDMLVDKETRMKNGQVDAWILPEETTIYTQIVPPEKTDYYLAGLLGPNRVNSEGDKRLARAGTTDPQDTIEPRRVVNNAPVYIARSFNVPNAGQLDLLSRVRQVGEYNTMIDHCRNYDNYVSASRNIMIYNEDIDAFSEITLEDAIMNCGLWDKDSGEVLPVQYDGRRGLGGQNLNDVRRDFLSYVDQRNAPGQIQTATRLYHIDPFYLPVKKVIAAAKTIEKALERDGFISSEISTLIAETNRTGEISGDGRLQALVKTVTTMLGSGVGVRKPTNFADEERANRMVMMALRGKVPVVATDANIGESVQGSTSEIDQQFMEYIATKMTPRSKVDEIQAIAISDMPMEAKIQASKQKLEDYVNEKVKGLKLKSIGKVAEFFNQSVPEYQARRAEAAAPASGSANVGEIAKYMEPGQNLEGTGFQYLYEGSKRKTTGNRTIDSNTYLRVLADRAFDIEQRIKQSRQGSSAQSRMRDTGAGLGLEGISSMAYGKRERQGDGSPPDAELREIYKVLNSGERHFNLVNSSGVSTIQKFLAIQFLQVPMTRESMLNLARHNILVPLNFLLFRPHIQYKTKSGIKVGTGGKAGKTFTGHSGLQIQHEAGRKMALMHFTTHMRCVVTNPRNVYVQHDLFSSEYLGGNNVEFFNKDTYRVKNNENLRQSIICVAIPCAETKIPSPMDASGRFYVEYNAGLLRKEDFEELHYSTAARYNAIYGFHQTAKKQGTDMPNFTPNQFSHDNRLMYQGAQFNYNPKTDSYDQCIKNRGHRGENIYAGVGQVFNGQLEAIKQIDHTKYSIM